MCLAKESELKDLISKMIVKDPAKRLTLEQIVEHPWMKKCSKDKKQIHNEEGSLRSSRRSKEEIVEPVAVTKPEVLVDPETIRM